MDLNKITVFNMLTARMGWLTARQKVLAQNVANADTPNYKARDLEALDFRASLRQAQSRLSVDTTRQGHLAARRPVALTQHGEPARQTQESTPSGNAVILEEEMMKVAETAASYDLMANLYEKSLGLIRTAITRPR